MEIAEILVKKKHGVFLTRIQEAFIKP